MKLASLVLFLCLTAPTLAPAQDTEFTNNTETVVVQTEAKVVLTAPSEACIGELVRLDATDSVADSVRWWLVPQSCPDFEVYDAGRKAVFSARAAGEYVFIVAVAKDSTVDVLRHVLTVKGPPPVPTTDSLAQLIPYWNWSEGLPKDECLKLADCFEKIAYRADELKTPEDWLKTTSETTREVLGDRIDAWKPMLNKIGANMKKRAETGALTSPEEHRKAWLEVAEGLRKC